LPDIECLPLLRNNRGWWNKLEVFRLTGPTIYFDLDTIIVGDITDLVVYPHIFTGLTNFKRTGFNSGFMGWCGDYSYLNQDIDRQTEKEYDGGETGNWDRHGDQGWIEDHLKLKPQLSGDLFPGRFVSYKWDVRRQGFVPKNASVVAFHGKPRPSDVNWSLPSGDRNQQ
jgi:hypothetical protein